MELRKKCVECNETLELNGNFRTYKQSKDGYYNRCIKCMIKAKRKGAKEGCKFCSKCKRELPATNSYFAEQSSCLDGLDGVCKECYGRNFNTTASEKWTDEDKTLLKQSVYTLPKEEILKLFPTRTWKAIRHMSLKMGLKLTNNYEKIYEDELYKNINEVKHMMCKSCRRYLPLEMTHFPKDESCRIGYRSICKECKGERFGIKEVVWDDKETEIIKSIYHEMTNREIQLAFFPNKTLEQLSHKGNVLGIHKSKEVVLRAKQESYTDEWREKISKTHKEKGYAAGENNPMYGTSRKGKENPNWQGGISELYEHLRRNIGEWKIASMKECDYKCVITGERFDDIHHTYSFMSIIHDTLNNLNLPVKEYICEYNDEELLLIEKECMRIHMLNLGVCLKREIHQDFHSIYGNKNNTKLQFEEFKNKYTNIAIKGGDLCG